MGRSHDWRRGDGYTFPWNPQRIEKKDLLMFFGPDGPLVQSPCWPRGLTGSRPKDIADVTRRSVLGWIQQNSKSILYAPYVVRDGKRAL